MGMTEQGYWRATRHPWPCLLFLLPLLGAYEGGVLWVGGLHPEVLRNGADHWLHRGLERLGLAEDYWAPGLILGMFLLWSWLRRLDRPDDALGVCLGMALESLAFALGLWSLSRGLDPFLKSLGIALNSAPTFGAMAAQVVTFVGAGIYEEVLFRLFLFSGLLWLFDQIRVPPLATYFLAAGLAALIFSAAHHAGPNGEAFDGYVFLFRTLAGLYFTLLFQVRGFGIAVGAHACYDVLVGLVMK
jgi:hypothetical protein